jgi:hypothetical protein
VNRGARECGQRGVESCIVRGSGLRQAGRTKHGHWGRYGGGYARNTPFQSDAMDGFKPFQSDAMGGFKPFQSDAMEVSS